MKAANQLRRADSGRPAKRAKSFGPKLRAGASVVHREQKTRSD
jgi:hypothetical protein